MLVFVNALCMFKLTKFCRSTEISLFLKKYLTQERVAHYFLSGVALVEYKPYELIESKNENTKEELGMV